eukprot:9471926-Pyramimonas_sp.AAC.1
MPHWWIRQSSQYQPARKRSDRNISFMSWTGGSRRPSGSAAWPYMQGMGCPGCHLCPSVPSGRPSHRQMPTLLAWNREMRRSSFALLAGSAAPTLSGLISPSSGTGAAPGARP